MHEMFKLASKMKPAGDQPQAIEKLTAGLKAGKRHQVLLGVTGSGKTYTLAQVVAAHQKPTLIISHNKTLAAQLYREFKEFFPKNAVHYFVSYYDYYQPEAYIPHTHTYIEKDSKVNEEIDRLRHAATQALMSRDDVIIIASVSCIYNLGSPEEYAKLGLELFEKKKLSASELIRNLERLQYAPDIELKRGCYRKTRDELEIVNPSGVEITRVKFKNNAVIGIAVATLDDPEELETGTPTYHKVVEKTIFPAKYWLTSDAKVGVAIENIKSELQKQVQRLKKTGKGEEALRLHERTTQDMEMLRRTGFCHGIENYSAHLDFRTPGQPPYTLLDYFGSKGEFLTIVDESHITIPQLHSMYTGDRSRKATLVEYGWRLPSAADNRPLQFPEFAKRVQQLIYVSATPSAFELGKAGKANTIEQVVRPTGLLDPTIEIRPTEGQIPHLLGQIRERIAAHERVIVTTLTKRMAEDLAEHLASQGIKTSYLHSEIKTLDRLKILKDFRSGVYDVLIGVNLLREGLDMPEVSLIAILDADKEGFLRNTTTLIQTMGRAARNVNGHVIMYADKLTRSIDSAVKETQRRRAKQELHNTKHGITPQTIVKQNTGFDLPIGKGRAAKKPEPQNMAEIVFTDTNKQKALTQLNKLMERAVRRMEYDEAMLIRDRILALKHEDGEHDK